jgi:quercetin dioxygenase-like cupin family protein
VFLNFHTPDGGFADNLRARDRGEEGGFDSVDVPPGSGKPPTDAIFWRPGEGERLEANNRVATIKVGREELTLIDFEIGPGFEGPDPHSHDDHVDSFYVLEGEVDFLAGDDWLRLPARSFIAAPMGVMHAFANRDGQRARLLNIHAPSTGFHERLREMS